MSDTEPQTAGGRCSGISRCRWTGSWPGRTTRWTGSPGVSFRPGLVNEYVQTTGAVLGGRTGWDHYPDASSVYGGTWNGPVFVLTHHPEDATPADSVTFLNCGPAEAVRIGLAAAGG